MGRRKQSSVFEDLYGIAAALPWWVGVALAIFAYVVLHSYAMAEAQATAVPGRMGQMVVSQVVKALSTYGQYIVPLALLAGALASWLGRRKRQGLVRSVAANQSGDALRQMTWRDFERLVGEVFRMRGYAVAETGGGGADEGIDLRLRKGNELALVQCKHWRAYKVPVTVVRELYGAMAAQGAAQGFVVTSGQFTADARAFASGRNIKLINGQALTALIKRASAAAPTGSSTKPPAAASAPAPTAEPPQPTDMSPAAAPGCPRCGSAMIQRIARQGANAGKPFWGCATFPECRGVRGL
ncbi:restriction endonuclease [Cupriavidus sp. TMH.W2]|uniref:restriction endonuclease n=1 Tax=Cupriavidus sp. TMH.W2 TaxID=3434465 RepID=UPI003D76B40A